MDWGFAQVDQQWYKTPALLADAERMYAEVKPLQPKYWRIGAAWSLIAKQKSPGTFVAGTPPTTTGRDWSTVDTHLNEALLMGVEIVLIVGVRKAAWGGFIFGIGATVGGSADFANFCAEVATRYKPGGVGIRTDGKYAPNAGKGVRIFEIWNEQNDQNHWGGQISAKDYTRFLTAGYDAIKAVTGLTGTPTSGSSPTTGQSLVLFGGTYHVQRIGSWLGYGIASLPEIEFLTQCYTYGAKDKFDAMAVHVYPSLDQSSYGGSDVGPVPTMNLDNMKQLVEIRALMVAKGDGAKKIWVTEAGFPTSDVTDDEQRDYWEQLWDLLEALSYIQVVLFYCVRDPTTDTKSFANTWGAMRYDFSHKPVWSWLQTLSPPPATLPAFAGSGALSATVVRAVSAAFSGAGALAATSPPRVTAVFTGGGDLSAMADKNSNERNANFDGSGSLSATLKPVLSATATFSGLGALSATATPKLSATPAFGGSGSLSANAFSGSDHAERDADFTGEGALSATAWQPVAYVSKGVGATQSYTTSAATLTWSDNISATSADTRVYAVVGFYMSTSITGISVSGTYGTTPMNFVGAGATGGFGVAFLELDNPATGPQTVSVVVSRTSGSGNMARLTGDSFTYKNTSGTVMGTAATNTTAGSRAVTLPAGPGSMALSALHAAATNQLVPVTLVPAVSGTLRFNSGAGSAWYTAQDAPGEPDNSVTNTAPSSSGSTGRWYHTGIVIQPIT